MLAASLRGVRSVGLELREFFLLERAERNSSKLTASQRESVQDYCQAARQRLAVARDLREPDQVRVAVSLQREAALLLIFAFVVSKDDTVDVRSIGLPALLERLDLGLRSDSRRAPQEFESARPLLVDSDPLSLHRLTALEANRKIDELEVGDHCAAAGRS